MITKLKEKILQHRLFICVLLVSIGLFLVAGYNKNVFHVDESLSYALANYDMGWTNYPFNGTHTRYVLDAYKVTNNAFKYDMVWHWQALDEHPPLYYAMLHTVCSFFPNSLSKWYGFSINLASLIVIETILYCLLLKLTNRNTIVSSFAVSLYALNPTVIQYSLLIRMYMMLGVAFVAFVYSAYQYLTTDKNKYIIYLFLATIFGGLSNYFFYVFLVVFCFLILVIFIVEKIDWKHIIKPIVSIVLATISNLFIFPYTLDLFFQENNSAIIAGNRFSQSIINFDRVRLFLQASPFKLWGTIALVIFSSVVLIYFLCNKKTFNTSFALATLVTYVVYFSIISTISFQASYRFVCAIDGLLIVVIGYSISLLFEKIGLPFKKQWLVCGVLFICSIPLVGINRLQLLRYEPLEIANENEGGNLIVFTPKETARYEIDCIFIERDKYGYVYNSDGSAVDRKVDDLYWLDNSIIYARPEFSAAYIKQWLSENTSLTSLHDLGTASHGYHIYQASR